MCLNRKFAQFSRALLLSLAGVTPALANPTGGSVVAGSAGISGQGTSAVTINQSSNKAIINWQTFSIGSGELTKFIQPSSNSAALNRVLGGQTSLINGTLSANGQVYLINGNGILVGPGGMINTAGFIGSTRDIDDGDFLNGKLHFTGSNSAGVQNLGKINALGGDVILIGKTVDNQGTINALKGTVGLAAGDDVLVTQSGSEHVFVSASDTPANAAGLTGVNNSGTIRATTAELKAANGNIYALAINNSGTIRATTAMSQGGRIFLVSDTGTVKNTGTLNASATAVGGKGGTVTLKTTGTAIHTGTILAKGGQGGAGGQVDISGGALQFSGLVDTTAPDGLTGNLILDPASLEVATGGSTTCTEASIVDPSIIQYTLETTSLTLDAYDSITITDGITWCSTSTLTLKTNCSGGTITINAPITGTNGTLNIDAQSGGTISTGAAGDVQVANFILTSGSWAQNSTTLPTFQVSNNFDISGGSFLRVTGGDGSSGSPYQITDIYGLQGAQTYSGGDYYLLDNNIDASVTQNWNDGQGFIPIGNPSNGSYTGTFYGQGYTIDSLYINNTSIGPVGLFGILGSGGVVENVGLTNVNITGASDVGALVGQNDGGSILSTFSTGTVSGTSNVGGLVGNNDANGSVIQYSYSSADVTGTSAVGGLVGRNDSLVEQSYSVASVNGLGMVGGLVGDNTGIINQSYFAEDSNNDGGDGGDENSVNGHYDVGGLVGKDSGTITGSYASGAVNGSSCYSTGGLVGAICGEPDISNNYFDSGMTGQSSAFGYCYSDYGGATDLSEASFDATGLYAGFDSLGAGFTLESGGSPLVLETSDGVWRILVGSQGKEFPVLTALSVQISGRVFSDEGITPVSSGTVTLNSGTYQLSGRDEGAIDPNGYYAFLGEANDVSDQYQNGNIGPTLRVTSSTSGDSIIYISFYPIYGIPFASNFVPNLPLSYGSVDIWGNTVRALTPFLSNTLLASSGSSEISSSANSYGGTDLTIAGNFDAEAPTGNFYTLDGSLTASGNISFNAPTVALYPVTIAATGSTSVLTLNDTIVSPATGVALLLESNGTFINNDSVGLYAPNGYWDIELPADSGNFYGPLVGTNPPTYNTPVGTPVTISGNNFFFATAAPPAANNTDPQILQTVTTPNIIINEIISNEFGLTTPTGNNGTDSGDGNVINGGDDTTSGKNIAHGSSHPGNGGTTGPSGPAQIITAGKGIYGIGAGGVGVVQPPPFVMKAFDAIFNSDSQGTLQNAAFATH